MSRRDEKQGKVERKKWSPAAKSIKPASTADSLSLALLFPRKTSLNLNFKRSEFLRTERLIDIMNINRLTNYDTTIARNEVVRAVGNFSEPLGRLPSRLSTLSSLCSVFGGASKSFVIISSKVFALIEQVMRIINRNMKLIFSALELSHDLMNYCSFAQQHFLH